MRREKYNLAEMLAEIEQEASLTDASGFSAGHETVKVSQEAIGQLFKQSKKAKEASEANASSDMSHEESPGANESTIF
jgi:hypothetical protein